MNRAELEPAIKWGNELIEEYKKLGREVPEFVYERQLQLYEQFMKEVTK